MIHKQKVHIPSSEKIVELFVSSCVKCDNDDIKIIQYEDQFGFISTAICTKCKQKISRNSAEKFIIQDWNKQNDVPTLIKDKGNLILALKQEIKDLKIKQKQRKKK